MKKEPVSWASTPAVRSAMVANRRRDTRPELRLRSELHRRGFRYRVDFPPVRGSRRRADVVFTRARVAVFVHGCFWHGCPDHCRRPGKNVDYWNEKLASNIRRDAETTARLEASGWEVIVVWEHDDPLAAADSIAARVNHRRTDR